MPLRHDLRTMRQYLDLFIDATISYGKYLWYAFTHPSWTNYFYYLLALSVLVFAFELLTPWRKSQAMFRKDFWLDLFYLFFNFFIFSLIGYNGLATVGVALFNDSLALVGVTNLVALELQALPVWSQLFIMFLIADFIQWNIHRLLHRVPWLWEFHKVHHSVKEMGFAAHFRFHFMESIIYKTLQYVPIAMLGFGIKEFFIVHIVGICIGHINHANLNWDYGPFKYILNNPKMHLWHHARKLPTGAKHGINYGLSLSVWDYLFGTAHIPYHDPNLELGFPGDENYPKQFHEQVAAAFKK